MEVFLEISQKCAAHLRESRLTNRSPFFFFADRGKCHRGAAGRYRDGARGEALLAGLRAPPGFPEDVLAAEWDRVRRLAGRSSKCDAFVEYPSVQLQKVANMRLSFPNV